MGVPRSFSIAAAVDATWWMTTTGIAMVFILKGKVQQHRQWMTRSFAVALVFLEVRVIGGLGGWENLDVHANETIVWACLAFSILSADIVLQWQELSRSRPVFHRRRAVSLWASGIWVDHLVNYRETAFCEIAPAESASCQLDG